MPPKGKSKNKNPARFAALADPHDEGKEPSEGDGASTAARVPMPPAPPVPVHAAEEHVEGAAAEAFHECSEDFDSDYLPAESSFYSSHFEPILAYYLAESMAEI